jgi:hypothetical protein
VRWTAHKLGPSYRKRTVISHRESVFFCPKIQAVQVTVASTVLVAD